MTVKRWPILVLFAAFVLGAPKPAAALAIANSSLDFRNLVITPAAGTLSLDGPWFLEAFAHADNSLGETADDFKLSISPDTVGAAAAVTWASAAGGAKAANDPPDFVVTGSATSSVSVPGCGPAFASSKGRGTLINSFTLSESGDVKFDINVAGLLNVLTDACGVEATTETVFTLEIDGTPILFRNDMLSIGRSDAATLSFAAHLTNTVTLDAGSHFLLLEADSESRGQVEVPEPPAGALLLAGLAVLAAGRRRRERLWFLLPVFVMAALVDTPASAAANALSQSANGIALAPSRNGIAINATSDGRACGKIFYNNVTLLVPDPVTACNNVNGPIPPDRLISFTDGAGNMVAAKAIKAAPIPGIFKAYFTRASTKSVNAGTFAEAEFRDPIMFSDPLGEAFDVDVTRSFLPMFDSDEGMTVDGLHLGGSSGSTSAQFFASMSSNLTGFLFSLGLTFSADQPLGVDVTLGAVSGQPGWDEMALESTLRALLDAGNADNEFSLSSFSFPSIRIHVDAGESLVLSLSDVSTAQVPEPAILWLFALGVMAFAVIAQVEPRPNWMRRT